MPGWKTQAMLWVAKRLRWKKLVPTLVELSGTVTLGIDDIPRGDFKDPPTGRTVYIMTQVWVINMTRKDILDTRCTIRWKRRGAGAFEERKVNGIWCKNLATGLKSYPEGVEEQTTLPSNGDTRHLGLVAKSAFTGNVHLVCTATYYAGQYPNYEHPDYVLDPGVYDVDLVFDATGGRRGHLGLEVSHEGGGADVIAIQR